MQQTVFSRNSSYNKKMKPVLNLATRIRSRSQGSQRYSKAIGGGLLDLKMHQFQPHKMAVKSINIKEDT